MIYLMPYKKYLRSTKALKEIGFHIRNAHSRMTKAWPVLYWGKPPVNQRGLANSRQGIVINPPASASLVTNKLTWAAARFSDSIEWTRNKTEALAWASEQGEKVVCRTVINGHSGEGIVIARNPRQVVDAPLYSRYFKKVREFRTYVAIQDDRHVVTYLASKRNRGNVQDRDNLLIRSGTKGWVYQVERVDSLSQNCELRHTIENFSQEFFRKVAVEEYSETGWILALDIAQSSTGECKLLEANLAPGLNDGTAGAIYIAAAWIVSTIRGE